MFDFFSFALGTCLQASVATSPLPGPILTPQYLVTYEQVVARSQDADCKEAAERYGVARAQLVESAPWSALLHDADYLAQQHLESRWAAECGLLELSPTACDSLSVERLVRRAQLKRSASYQAVHASAEAEAARKAQQEFTAQRCDVGALPLQETAVYLAPTLPSMPDALDAIPAWATKVEALIKSPAYDKVRSTPQHGPVQATARQIMLNCPRAKGSSLCDELYSKLQEESEALAKTEAWRGLKSNF